MRSLQRSHRAFFSGESMREGTSITEEDQVVQVTPTD
jgi:hypothetical protein